MHKDSQFWFAFTFKGKRYTYTRLPQGYCESPTIYSQVLASSLSTFEPPNKSQLLTYVDDILVASETKEGCETETIALLKHLAEEGHKVSKNKLQFCQEKSKVSRSSAKCRRKNYSGRKKNCHTTSTQTINKETNDVLFRTHKLLQKLGA